MSSLRGRTRDSSWQWLVIGVVLGLGCSGVLCLGLYLSNVVRFGIPGQADVAAAPTVIVVTEVSGPATQAAVVAPPQTTPTSTQALKPLVSATPLVAGSPVPATITPFDPAPTDSTSGNSNPSTPNTAAVQPTFVGSEIPSPAPPTAAQSIAAANSPTAPAANIAGAGAPAGSTSLPPSIAASALVTVQGGIFEMGTTLKEAQTAVDDCTTRDKGKCDLSMAEDSYPPHNVTVNSFRMEKYEVSYEQYVAFLNYLGPNSHKNLCDGNPCVAVNGVETPGSYIKFDGTKYSVTTDIYLRRPVAYVTWYGADMYCKTIGRRLPTEAEWERAARQPGDKRIYPWGNDWNSDQPKARTSRPKNEGGPDTVDSYSTGNSIDGIYNLAGNVSEWVFDWYDANYYKTQASGNPIDPQGPKDSPTGRKVTRGGDWDAPPFFARAVHRRDADPGVPTSAIGFRCAADQDLTQPAGAKGTASTPAVAPTKGAQTTGQTTGGQTTNTNPQPTATFTPGSLPSGNKP